MIKDPLLNHFKKLVMQQLDELEEKENAENTEQLLQPDNSKKTESN